MKILITEDDALIREGVSEFLSEFGYETVTAGNGVEALSIFNKEKIDLIILDINMPFMNGLEVLKEIRNYSDIPVIILTAYNDEDYKIKAFSNLADGYIEKPLSLPVLKARIDALVKRYFKKTEKFIYKNLIVYFSSYTAMIDNKNIEINPKEIEILKYLVENQGIALTRADIINNVWKDTEEIPFDRVVDVYIKEIRKKLKLDCIITIRNVGYKLELK